MQTRPARRFSRYLQYRLATLLIVMFVCGVGLAWVARERRVARRQKQVCEKLEKLRCHIEWRKARSRRAAWQRSLLGDDSFASPLGIDAEGRNVTDAEIAEMLVFDDLNYLNLSYTLVTDDGLKHLENLHGLESLSLNGTPVTDAGMMHVGAIHRLKHLYLNTNKSITDAGLERLLGLKRLQSLDISFTATTEDGIAQLIDFPQLHTLLLSGPEITDSAAAHLANCAALRELYLHNTEVTQAGIDTLEKAIPELEVYD